MGRKDRRLGQQNSNGYREVLGRGGGGEHAAAGHSNGTKGGNQRKGLAADQWDCYGCGAICKGIRNCQRCNRAAPARIDRLFGHIAAGRSSSAVAAPAKDSKAEKELKAALARELELKKELEKLKVPPAGGGAEGGTAAMEVEQEEDIAGRITYHEEALRHAERSKAPSEILKMHQAALEQLKAEKLAGLSDAERLKRCEVRIKWEEGARDKAAAKLEAMRNEYQALQEKWAKDLRDSEHKLEAAKGRVEHWVAEKAKVKCSLAAAGPERSPAAATESSAHAALLAHLRTKAGDLDDVTKQLLEAVAADAAPQAPAAAEAAGSGTVAEPPAAVVAAGGGGGEQGAGAAPSSQNAGGGGQEDENEDECSEEDKKATSMLDEFLARQDVHGGSESMRKAMAAKNRGTPYGKA